MSRLATVKLATGLDRLLDDVSPLVGRRFAVLGHSASLSADLEPIHLALARRGLPPSLLLGPEHGFFGVEQDMVAAADARDSLTGAQIRSLYGDDETSLRPQREVFDGIDLLVIDLQDVGARYYTYAATAAWAAEVALDSGCEVLVLDRPNPLGGEVVEGPPLQPGFESFVGVFAMPIRHGLTVGEIVHHHLRSLGRAEAVTVLGHSAGRDQLWPACGRPFVAPSPNMPSFDTAVLYPGLCLLEATTLSEGRGTTRPFRLIGAPGLDPYRLTAAIARLATPGVAALPMWFRPQFQKHAGAVCGGVELVVTDPFALAPVAFGCRLLDLLWREFLASGGTPEGFWRRQPYEFVRDRPAVDLLAGGTELRVAVESGVGLEDWIASWGGYEQEFRETRRADLLGGSE